MGTWKYKPVVAAILVGAFLFSPLLCGMTCLEMGGIRPNAATEMVAPGAGEFVGEFVKSGVVGCVVTHIVLKIDFNEWGNVFRVGNRVWDGVEAAYLIEGMLREGLQRMQAAKSAQPLRLRSGQAGMAVPQGDKARNPG